MAAASTLVQTGGVRPKPPNAGKGRVKGVPNKATASVKAAFLEAFERRGGAQALLDWSNKPGNETEFYKLAIRLIPTEVSGVDGAPIQTESKLDVAGLSDAQIRALASISVK